MRICFLIHQIGHYHHARFQHLGKYCDLHVIEIFPASSEYGWTDNFENTSYTSYSRNEKDSVSSLLKQIHPQKIYTCGWSSLHYFKALLWGKKRKIPVWGISDSRVRDKSRKTVVEKIKGVLIQPFSGFLVAGTESREYLRSLGFKKDIRQPWDVVDNTYFETDTVKNEPDAFKKLKLPKSYILYNARYIPKKNHHTFLEAYKKLLDTGIEPLPVVMIGNGELKESIESKIKNYNLNHLITTLDFVQYNLLPFFYKNAKFVILPSISDQWGLVVNEALASGTPVIVSDNCGASVDLVTDNINGYIIPTNLHGIYTGLNKAHNVSEKEYKEMCNNCSAQLTKFTLESFAQAVLE